MIGTVKNLGTLVFAIAAGVVMFFVGSAVYSVGLGILGGAGVLSNSASYLAYGPAAGIVAGAYGAAKTLGWST